MSKIDKLKEASGRAAQKTTEECASKIQKLTDSQIDKVIEELKNSTINKAEVDRLHEEIQKSTDKNRSLTEFTLKSENFCNTVLGILNKIL